MDNEDVRSGKKITDVAYKDGLIHSRDDRKGQSKSCNLQKVLYLCNRK